MQLAPIAIAAIITISSQSILRCQHPRDGVRGVWLTNVGSKALDSKRGLEDAVRICSKVGINTIFVVVWNRGVTQYPSKLMEEMFGIRIDPRFTGRDPLAELIQIAHAKGINVHAWFEFGFSSAYKAEGQHILQRYPGWASKGVDGKVVVRDDFEWMNGFLPEVQHFLLEMMKEVVLNYEVDGVQGDDRLPALPCEVGYDEHTVAQYRLEHNNASPPRNPRDSAWIEWRANRLNTFMKQIHDTLKALKPTLLISSAPGPYPWSKEEYLQDWPTWLANGWVDYVFPLLYRYDIEEYNSLLRQTIGIVGERQLDRLYPGILISLADGYLIKENLLQKMLEANVRSGVRGESFFYFEGIEKLPGFFERYPKQRKDTTQGH